MKVFFLVFFLMFTIYGICETASVTLTKRGNSGTVVCPNDMLIYECVTTNTSALTWYSEEYIGPPSSSVIRFSGREHMLNDGVRKNFNEMVSFAQLTRRDNITAKRFNLTSVLRIEADPGTPNATFTCANEEMENTSLHYSLSELPDKPTFITPKNKSSPLQPVGIKGKYVSYKLEWIPPSNVEKFVLSYYEICSPDIKENFTNDKRSVVLMLDITNVTTAKTAVVGLRAFSMCGQPSPMDNITLSVPAGSRGVQTSGAKLNTLMVLFTSLLMLIH